MIVLRAAAVFFEDVARMRGALVAGAFAIVDRGAGVPCFALCLANASAASCAVLYLFDQRVTPPFSRYWTKKPPLLPAVTPLKVDVAVADRSRVNPSMTMGVRVVRGIFAIDARICQGRGGRDRGRATDYQRMQKHLGSPSAWRLRVLSPLLFTPTVGVLI